MLRRGTPTIFAWALLIAACGSFGPSTSMPPQDAATGDAGDAGTEGAACTDTTSDPANCGSCGARCGTGTTCVASTCVPGCRDKVLYVSGDGGKDDNDGCTIGSPLRTIGAAFARVATQSLVGHEVHICRGTYAERSLLLDHALTMRGGYNCVTWTRAPGYGADGGFADPNETLVTNADYGASISTLEVSGMVVDASVTIEGLTFVGAATGARSSQAILVRDGASPLIKDVHATGGGTSNPESFGSVGVYIRDGAHPELANSVVTGGTGTQAPYGSAGVVIGSASGSIHDTKIGAGTGHGALGCVGIYIDAGAVTRPTTLDHDIIAWDGCQASNSGSSAIGIDAQSGVIDVTASRVLGGTTTCAVGTCSSIGLLSGKTRLRIRANVVYAGDVTGPSNVATEGLLIDSAEGVEVAGNVIHAGGSSSGPNIVTIGVDVVRSNNTSIIGNTIIFAGPANAQPHVGIRLAGDVGNTNGPKNTSIIGNALVGALAGTTREFGIERWACTGATAMNVHQNVFVSVTNPGRDVADLGALGACDRSVPYALPTAMDTAFGVSGGDDKAISPSCNNSSNCFKAVQCTDAASCASATFQAWDAPSFDVLNVKGATGVHLKPALPCAIAQSSYALPAGVLTDAYGAPRTSPLSIGAAEQETCE